MSYITKLPQVVVKPGNMISYWSSKLKVAVILLALALYVYCLLIVKTMYLKSKRLDHIMEMEIDTEKLMRHVQKLDQNLAMKIDRIDDPYEDY